MCPKPCAHIFIISSSSLVREGSWVGLLYLQVITSCTKRDPQKIPLITWPLLLPASEIQMQMKQKNYWRNSGGTLRQKFILIDFWHSTNGPMDQWTNGPVVQWTNGPMDQCKKVNEGKMWALSSAGSGQIKGISHLKIVFALNLKILR